MPVAPYPARAALSWAKSPVDDLRVKRPGAGNPGDWKYAGRRGSRAAFWLAMFASAALHLILIVGFNEKPVKKTEVAAADESIIRLELPPLPKEEEPPPEEYVEEAVDDPGVIVPMLADIPSRVPVATDFVQTMQLNVPVDTANMAADLSRVPVQITHKPSAAGLKDLFDLAQLDRVPEPLAQPAPVFPYDLRGSVSQAEVLVEFIVTSVGSVQYATIVSSTHAGFERAALDGVAKWRFRPGVKSGRKVNTRMRVPLRFRVVLEDT